MSVGAMADDAGGQTRAFVGAWTWLAESLPGGVYAEHDGVVVAASGLPFAPLNPAFVVRDPDDPVAALRWSAATRLERGAPSTGVDLPDGRLPAVESALGALGYVQHVQRPGMSVAVADIAQPPAPADLRIRTIESAADWAGYVDVQVGAFGMAREIASEFPPYSVVGTDPRMAMLVGAVDGQVVCAAAVFVTGVDAGIFAVGTLAEWRGRGFGAAITAAAVRTGAAAGGKVAHLQSTEDGYPVYRRLGFRTGVPWVVWVDPATEPSA